MYHTFTQDDPQLNVLVVDDHPVVRNTLETTMQHFGNIQSSQSSNAQDALKQACSCEFDVVICDLKMPEEDGISFLRKLSNFLDPPDIILITGEGTTILNASSKLAQSFGLNVLGTSCKPLSACKLHRMLAVDVGAPVNEIRSKKLQISDVEVITGFNSNLFEVYFQPQVRTQDLSPVGMEALIRYNHPLDGILTPDSFLKIAEKSMIIDDLNEFICQKSIDYCKSCHEKSFDISVSINLSPETLTDIKFPDKMLSMVQAAGIEAGDIHFELTEASVTLDGNILLDIVTRLSLMGFKISIDDYGMGYSTLEQILNLPFTELKVDKSFVLNCLSDAKALSILESSLDLSTRLGLHTVAEGIESEAQLIKVKELGGEIVQGFYLGRPMPEEDMTQWLEKQAMQAK